MGSRPAELLRPESSKERVGPTVVHQDPEAHQHEIDAVCHGDASTPSKQQPDRLADASAPVDDDQRPGIPSSGEPVPGDEDLLEAVVMPRSPFRGGRSPTSPITITTRLTYLEFKACLASNLAQRAALKLPYSLSV